MRPTNITDLLESQDGGTFKERVEGILSDVAAAVIDHGTKGQVILKMDLTQISSSCQVNLTTTLSYKRPRPRGDLSENYTAITPMYVNSGGKITLFPENQVDMFQQKHEAE